MRNYISLTLIVPHIFFSTFQSFDEVLLRVKQQRNILHEISKRKANWIDHILRRNCLLQRVIEREIRWGIESDRRWAGHVARMVELRGVYRVLLGKPEGRRSLGRPRRRWVDNIRMDLQEVGGRYMDWIGLA